MKRILLFCILILTLTSFAPLKKQWVKTKKENIILYTRPAGFTKTNSPDSAKINAILNEGIACVKEINEILGVDFNSEIKVYLYNYDEAQEQIGTNGGGGAIPAKRKILYTYFEKCNKDLEKNRDIYIGLHEYVHVISFNSIGFPKIRLFTEGYANAIDGHYGSKEVNGVLVSTPVEDYIKISNIMKPSELLDSVKMFEGYFYPQSGFFMKWLFEKYSVKTVNKLFVLPRENFENEFKTITGESFGDMENKYLEYCRAYFSKQ